MSTQPPGREIAVFYEKDKDYKLIGATGVHGGLIPSGDILAEFFVEHRNAPDSVILNLSESPPKEIKREGGNFVRTLQIGILLRPDMAYTIGKWLIEKAEQVGYKEIKQ